MKSTWRSLWCLALMLLLPGAVRAANLVVSGQYESTGTTLVISVQVGSPPPVAFIVLQHLPTGIKVIQATPRPAGQNRQTGTLKWFFKKPQVGRHTLTIKLSEPVSKNRLRGEIRYRHPISGKMVSSEINP